MWNTEHRKFVMLRPWVVAMVSGLWSLVSGLAWAAEAAQDATPKMRIVIIVLTVVVALLIGMLLYHFSQRSAQDKFKAAGAGEETPPEIVPETAGLPQLMPLLLEQLKPLPGSAQQHERVARTVSDVATQTLQTQVQTVAKRLHEQYGTLLEERRRTVTVLERKYRETLQEQKQTTAVLESVAEGLVVINTKGEVVMMNPAAERLLRVGPESRIGKPLLEHVSDEQLVSLIRPTTEGSQEIVLNAPQESTKRVLRASNAMITDENGKTVGMVAVLSDVTKQREVEQMKSDFLSTVSHELRTPIMAMRHAVSLLSDQVLGPLNAEQQQFAELTQRNLNQLQTLLNDLLDLAKLEARKMALHLEPRAIAPALQAVCDSLDPWAKSKALTMTKRVSDGLPNVPMDEVRIIQVLTNLIGNAIKFTPNQGRITIEAKPSGSNDAIEVSVSDTGSGIAAEDLPKLFSKFQQVGERAARDLGGTGLGLAIAKEIVELHHGRIWAESDGKQGVRFTFTVPVSPGTP
jgi:PAS domain S-box-containing protein